MTTPVPARPPDGVYFAHRDRAGFARRVACDAVDLAAMLVAWFVMAFSWAQWHPWTEFREWPILGAWLLFCYVYLAPLKASRVRTLGYRLAGLRVVDLRGRRPSLVRMSLRLVPLLFGTGFWLIDLGWGLGDDDRRRFSDLFAGTYVVRAGAVPEGRGPVVAAYYYALGYCLVFGEVSRPPGAPRLRPA